jgi:hypothetical protein
MYTHILQIKPISAVRSLAGRQYCSEEAGILYPLYGFPFRFSRKPRPILAHVLISFAYFIDPL